MIAPISWQQFDPHRACKLCKHGRASTGATCANPAVQGRGQRPVPVEQARANHGACGPEAAHMEFVQLQAA